mmetsp:Transcript_10433/g.28042  ORF Transcript_10433/g.28042 Transcript_10433/m.28042 type:complete len:307 (-) Transcript_10433:10-930(-)
MLYAACFMPPPVPCVLLTTLASRSDICSLASASSSPSTRNRRSSATCRNGSGIPSTSCSDANPVPMRLFKMRHMVGTSFRMRGTYSLGSQAQSSSASCAPAMRTPWCLSLSSDGTAPRNCSVTSGAFLTMRTDAKHAFLRTYDDWLLSSLQTSLARSRHISGLPTPPSAQSESPTTKWFLDVRSLFMLFVTSMRTSCLSSSSRLRLRYPTRLSANDSSAMSLRHSICPKCVGYPSMCMNMSFATFLCLCALSCSLKAVRRAAASRATSARSSAAVRHARTPRMNSARRCDIQGMGRAFPRDSAFPG